MNTITPLSSIPGLGSSTSQQGGQQTQTDQPKGEILKALVVEARSNNRFVLDFGGTKIVAASKAPLSVGQQLHLQVTGTSPQIELSIVSDFFSALAGKPLVLLGNNIDLAGLFATLKQGVPSPFSQLTPASTETLETFLPADLRSLIDSKQGGEFIAKLFNRLGINLENLIARGNLTTASNSLKSSLLEILHRFKGVDHITEQATKLLATLELYQFAQLQLNQQNILIFPLPFPFLNQGYLLIEDYDTQEDHLAENKDNFHFSLHLSMTGLGNMKIEFIQGKEELFIRFNMESKQKAAFLSQFQETLKDMISTVPVSSITFTDNVESPATELVRKIFPSGESILNTTA